MKFAAIVKPAIGLLAVTATAGALALAASDSASGDGEGKTATVVELVASERGDAGSADAAPLAPNTFVPTDDVVSTTDAVATTDVATSASADQPDAATVQSGWLPPDAAPALAPSAATIAPSPATAAADLTPGRDVLVAAPVALPAPVTAPFSIPVPADGVYRDPAAPFPQFRGQTFTIPVPPPAINPLPDTPTGSVKVMELERDHWQLKARGLEKKAEALRMKAEALVNRDDAVDRAELLELEAEAVLASAEVKLCEARAEQLDESIEQTSQQPSLPTVLPPTSSAYPVPAPSTASFSSPTTTVPATSIWNGPDATAGLSPLRIDFSASPSPARVGTPAGWKFKVQNASNQIEERIELRIPMPDFVVVNPEEIVAPANVDVRVEKGVIVFSPVASLRANERLVYQVPYTPKRKGTFILRANAASKSHPNGVAIAAPVWALEADEALPSTQPGVLLPRQDGMFASVSQADVALPVSRELLDLVSKLQKANEELERRLKELERLREAPVK